LSLLEARPLSLLEQLDELVAALESDAWKPTTQRTLSRLLALREAIAPDTPS
jgi:hypothetical protein